MSAAQGELHNGFEFDALAGVFRCPDASGKPDFYGIFVTKNIFVIDPDVCLRREKNIVQSLMQTRIVVEVQFAEGKWHRLCGRNVWHLHAAFHRKSYRFCDFAFGICAGFHYLKRPTGSHLLRGRLTCISNIDCECEARQEVSRDQVSILDHQIGSGLFFAHGERGLNRVSCGVCASPGLIERIGDKHQCCQSDGCRSGTCNDHPPGRGSHAALGGQVQSLGGCGASRFNVRAPRRARSKSNNGYASKNSAGEEHKVESAALYSQAKNPRLQSSTPQLIAHTRCDTASSSMETAA